MKYKIRIVSSIVLLFNFSNIIAQSSLTLKDCLEYAYEHNHEMTEYENNIRKNKLSFKQSTQNVLPSVKAVYNHHISSGRSLNIETYSWDNRNIQQGDLTLAADLVVFKGLYNLYKREYDLISVNMSNLKLQQKKLLLSIEITKIYYRIVLTNINVKILDQINSNTKEEINKQNELILAGANSMGGIYELKAQGHKEELEILELLNNNEKNMLYLSELLNWPADEILSISTDFHQNTLLNMKGCTEPINKILNKSVITSLAQEELYLTDKAIQLKRSYLYPTISLTTKLSSWYQMGATNPLNLENNYIYTHQMNNNLYKQMTLTFYAPIFNKRKIATELKLLQIDNENKRVQLENRKRQLTTELKSIKADILHIKQKIEHTHHLAETYKKSYAIAIEKYRSGLLDAYILNTSKNNYITSLMQRNRLQIELSLNTDLLWLYDKYR